jgi:hypothetical protein
MTARKPGPLSKTLHATTRELAEADLHRRFGPLREKGEWFRLEAPLVEFILSIRAGTPWVPLGRR